MILPSMCWAIFRSMRSSASTIDLFIQGWMWCRSLAILASSFWTLSSGTRVAEGVKREELGVVLPLRIDSTGVVSVGSYVA